MGRVYCSSDWHGCKTIVDKVFDYLQEDDKLIFCGDAIDRGEESLPIVLRLINDPRCVYLMGNHESMAATALKDYINSSRKTFQIETWSINGGDKTLNEILDNEDKYDFTFWYNTFSKLPPQYIYINKDKKKIICDHSGFTPKRASDPYWNRRHFIDTWTLDDSLQDTIIVHGHTPVHYFGSHFSYRDIKGNITRSRVPDKVLTYCSGHKINVDLCSIATNKMALLDLDTFEEIYFSEE